MAAEKIIICDDEPSIRRTLSEILEDEHYKVGSAASGEDLLQQLKQADSRVDLILLDVWLPGLDGVETLARVKASGLDAPVIMMSGHATMENAVKATRLGAYDFLEKPLNMDKVLLVIANALKQSKLEKKQSRLSEQLPTVEMVGESESIVKLKNDMALAAPSPGRVLIFGESGSGKEVAARLIHQWSKRADEPFVEMNCAAIPEELIESELFGHVKGSFTGAVGNRQGKFLQADGGTLFLDEIGDMSLKTQAKVLRVLQEQRFEPVGGTKTIHVDVRVIAATNKDLVKEIEGGNFREDLYYRLNVIPLYVPPLRERPEDLAILCGHFSQSFAKAYGRKPIQFSPEALQCMSAYRWPGNVRELRNTVERLLIMCQKDTIEMEDLPQQLLGREVQEELWFGNFDSLRDARDNFEKRYIEYSLRIHGGNITKTSDALKTERSNLHKKIKMFGIDVNQFS